MSIQWARQQAPDKGKKALEIIWDSFKGQMKGGEVFVGV